MCLITRIRYVSELILHGQFDIAIYPQLLETWVHRAKRATHSMWIFVRKNGKKNGKDTMEKHSLIRFWSKFVMFSIYHFDAHLTSTHTYHEVYSHAHFTKFMCEGNFFLLFSSDIFQIFSYVCTLCTTLSFFFAIFSNA